MNRVTILRVLIVLLVFPVVAHLIYTVITMPLRPALGPVFETAGQWSDVLGKAFLVASALLGARVAYAVCRRLWPYPTFRELTAAEEAARAKAGTSLTIRSRSS